MAVGTDRDAKNKKLGAKGEKLACRYLRRSGYRILEHGYKNPFGEVDIIASKGEVVAFIEVKTRTFDAFGSPSEAVDRRRKEKYVNAARYYFCGKVIDVTVRFDIIEVTQDGLNHIINAFY